VILQGNDYTIGHSSFTLRYHHKTELNATVNSTGNSATVTAISSGYTKITASIEGITESCTVIVEGSSEYTLNIYDETKTEIIKTTKIPKNALINITTKTKSAELHCVIGDTSYWKGGYGSETYKLLMDYGFEELGLNKIYGYQLLHNYGAHRVVEKLGWKREGLLRQEMYGHGKLHDVYYVACLREDWENWKINK
jgi:hypothetical protein